MLGKNEHLTGGRQSVSQSVRAVAAWYWFVLCRESGVLVSTRGALPLICFEHVSDMLGSPLNQFDWPKSRRIFKRESRRGGREWVVGRVVCVAASKCGWSVVCEVYSFPSSLCRAAKPYLLRELESRRTPPCVKQQRGAKVAAIFCRLPPGLSDYAHY